MRIISPYLNDRPKAAISLGQYSREEDEEDEEDEEEEEEEEKKGRQPSYQCQRSI
ncbi:hypothetical protein SAMD00023353_1900060 [Rosellinia necatrix]|uniref:Uncharacterized protein n=1 Tax=Rosellinia necatrix TaxID=77044 RepID=A0A1S8A7F6_ROSNE|nr:hypothetical protein SAMD00023353_1900060 [Rosellinia necatrix]